MSFFITQYILFFTFGIFAGVYPQTSGQDELISSEYNKIVIAKVVDREITLKDFIERSEYTIRAPYCRGKTNNDKNIVLNTLIAEKLLAISSDNKELLHNEKFRSFILGRREQKMREVLYNNEGISKVRLDTSEIKKIFSIAGRTYNIDYYNIDNNSVKTFISDFADKDSAFDSFFKYYGLSDSIREKKVGWNSPELPVIHNALFSMKLRKSQVIGPIKVSDSTNLLIRIKGWNNRVVVSQKDIRDRYDAVVEKLTAGKADSIFESYVLKVMGNKRLDFHNENLNKLVKILAPFYLNRKQEADDQFLELVFGNKTEIPDFFEAGSEYMDISLLPVFTIDGITWNINDLKKEIEKHPLVFRKNRNFTFAEQLRLAIVDLVRDKYLTDEAYKSGYEKLESVVQYETNWFDAGAALFQRNKYLSNYEVDSIHSSKVMEEYLNPYIEGLLKKYSGQIEINVQEYNKIKLSGIDMFTTQSDVPYTIYVPAFPLITTYNRLDYGTRLNNK